MDLFIVQYMSQQEVNWYNLISLALIISPSFIEILNAVSSQTCSLGLDLHRFCTTLAGSCAVQ